MKLTVSLNANQLQLLLAVLGCVIQDRGRENFITPALTMDESSQSEMRMLILSTICKDDGETKLQPGFHEVLKQKQGAVLVVACV